MTSFIQSDQVWLIWAVVISLGAFAILAEQKDKVIWGQSVVGLDPNCSIHGVLSHSVVSDSL